MIMLVKPYGSDGYVVGLAPGMTVGDYLGIIDILDIEYIELRGRKIQGEDLRVLFELE